MDHANRDRVEFQRVNEIESYFFQQKATDVTLIALALFIGLYIEKVASCLIILLSLVKLIILLVYSIIEKKAYDGFPISTRSIQFWLYRLILFLQLLILVWVVFEVMSHGTPGTNTQ